ncbi:MAG: chemotaxis protein CheA [Verrucomicrobia bacterium]|nr:chemotaxis protein CheA [Verrucomicrobiota bacterium]
MEPEIILSLDLDLELFREFLNDAQEHLDNIEQGVLVLETTPSDEETINTIFRAFHTFKGNAGFLDLVPMSELAHTLESLLGLARDGTIVVDKPIIDIILEGRDVLNQFVVEINNRISGDISEDPIIVPTQNLRDRVKTMLDNPPSPDAVQAESSSEVTVPEIESFDLSEDDFPPEEEQDSSASETTSESHSNASAVEEPATSAVEPDIPKAQKPSAPVPTAVSSSMAAPQTTAIKVATTKLDSLVDLVGEFVIAQSVVMQDIHSSMIGNNQFLKNLTQLNRISRELQHVAMSMRMVPIRSTFQKMTRLVRDVADRQNKEVKLLLDGQDTEIDRTVVEKISDPLIHMIRNAVDHGIETKEARVANGKPEYGTILLRAFHQSGNIVIEITDDGAGLSRERILKKAIEKGVVSPNAQLSDSEVYNLIFEPGFSTAAQVTDISGRGVGMDVVRRNIHEMRGKIRISSVEGHGSTFTIFLPLTLAIIEGLIIKVGSQRFVVPVSSVRESFRITSDMLTSTLGKGEVLNVRNQLIPLLRLSHYLTIDDATEDVNNGIVIHLESEHQSRCLLVDALVGKQEVVIKNLGDVYDNDPAIAGGTILGDGQVVLILDPSALVKLSNKSMEPSGMADSLF